jgi:hypothetical protein
MSKIQVDGKDYELTDLSDETRAQLASIQYIDAELLRLNALVAALQTARISYSNAVKEKLPKM